MTVPPFEPGRPPAPDQDTGTTTAVIAALSAEARSARPLVRHGWRLIRAGVGGARARVAAERMLASGARRLLVWGTAGGLDPALAPGTLLVPAVVIGLDGTIHAPDPVWRSALLEVLSQAGKVSEVPLAAVDSAVGSVAGKAELRSATGAGAVDMETAAIASVAEAAGTAWAVVRVVADSAQSALPQAVVAAVNSRRFAFRLAYGLALRPREFFDVLHLAREFRRACDKLNEAARALAD